MMNWYSLREATFPFSLFLSFSMGSALKGKSLFLDNSILNFGRAFPSGEVSRKSGKLFIFVKMLENGSEPVSILHSTDRQDIVFADFLLLFAQCLSSVKVSLQIFFYVLGFSCLKKIQGKSLSSLPPTFMITVC